MKTFKETKEFIKKQPKKERFGYWMTYFKMRLNNVWSKFINSSFVNHLSFLWHWKNFFFCLKYPFWKSRNVWSGKFMGYAFTWYDDIPDGWKKAFGKQLCEDIKKAGKESRKRLHKKISWKNMISWQQIKEKWGYLCLYASATEEIMNVLEHYEDISADYCYVCGQKSKYWTKGYVLPLCDKCMEEEVNRKDSNGKFIYKADFRKNWKKECIMEEAK